MPSTEIVKLRPRTLNFDLPPAETGPDAYTYGFNAQFYDGYVQRSLGWEAIFPAPAGTPQYLINLSTPTANYWVCACDDRILVTDTTSWFDITPTDGSWAAPTDKNQWTGGLLNGVVVLNNGQSSPWGWDGNTGNPMTELPGWPADTTCAAIRPFKFHLIAMNITDNSGNYPDQVNWSDAAPPGGLPTNWTPGPSGDAGDVQLSATPIPIIDGEALRDTFVIYKQHSTYTLQYTGGVSVFTVRKLFASSGILARNCVTEYEGMHYVLTDGDVIRHDGQNMQSIVKGRDQRGIFDAINAEYFQSCFVALNKQRGEVMFCYPNGAATVPDWAMCYAVKEDAIGIRQIGAAEHIAAGAVTVSGAGSTWNDATADWDNAVGSWDSVKYSAADDGLLIANSAEDRVFYLDATVTQDGAQPFFGLKKDYYDFGVPGQLKTVVRLWPQVNSFTTGDITIRVGSSPKPTGPVSFGDYYTFDPATDEYVDILSTGRYLSFQFTAFGGDVNMMGFDVELRKTGGRY